jgi:polysaccharide export outer membrane protein
MVTLSSWLATPASKAVFLALVLWGLPSVAVAQSASPVNDPAAIAAQEADGYLLGPGDRLRIDFFSVPEFTGDYQILPNGTVNLPQVGAVAIQGQTLKQASQIIAARYDSVLQRPVITLSLVAARPVTIAIAGEVNRPGSYALAPNEAGIPRLTRIIQLAEGITQAADLRQVKIRRPRPGSPGVDDLLTVNLWDLISAGNLRQDLPLRDGDSIFIPAMTTVNLEDARQLASATIAPRGDRPMKIAIVGEVNRPGPYTITAVQTTPNNPASSQVPSVTRAIQLAGGITQLADIRNIRVRRLTKTGTEQVIPIDFWQLLKSGDLRQDLPLQDGDTVEIATAKVLSDKEATELAAASFSPEKIGVNVVGEVEKAGTVAIPPNTPLNQALLAAGGFNRRAYRRSVTLVRLNLNGTVSKREIAIDLAQGVNEQTNPPLRANDTIIVKRSGISAISDTVGTVLSPFTGVFGLFRLLGL